MAAYKAAIDDGADGFECDVRITKDKQLVLWHDADMQRVAGSGARIADSTLSEIKHKYPEAITHEDFNKIVLMHEQHRKTKKMVKFTHLKNVETQNSQGEHWVTLKEVAPNF